MRKDYAGKPVVFIAVISGASKSGVEGYVKSTGFEWPVLVDESRATEAAYGHQISLSNIMQWNLVDPEGEQGRGLVKDFIEQNLSRAKFLFDGIAVPAKLRPLAQEIEMGQYEPYVGELAAAAQKGAKDIQEPAKAMFERVRPFAEKALEAAKAFESNKQLYLAYQEYAKVAAWFKKTEFEAPAAKAMAQLKKEKEVQQELAAQQVLAQAKALRASSKKPDQAQGLALLQMIPKKYPGTEAAKEAEKLAK